jgi:hypothetical protein
MLQSSHRSGCVEPSPRFPVDVWGQRSSGLRIIAPWIQVCSADGPGCLNTAAWMPGISQQPPPPVLAVCGGCCILRGTEKAQSCAAHQQAVLCAIKLWRSCSSVLSCRVWRLCTLDCAVIGHEKQIVVQKLMVARIFRSVSDQFVQTLKPSDICVAGHSTALPALPSNLGRSLAQ